MTKCTRLFCVDCPDSEATTTRAGQPTCASCAALWDERVNPKTEARFRRDVSEWFVQPGWGDSSSVLQEYDRRAKDIQRGNAIEAAARTLVEGFQAPLNLSVLVTERGQLDQACERRHWLALQEALAIRIEPEL